MIKLAWVFSFLTLILLSNEFFETEQELSKNNQKKLNKRLIEPLTIANELLGIEKEWLALQKQADLDKANKAAAKNNKKALVNSDEKLFTVGDGQYQLLGILVNQKSPFILVKIINKTISEIKPKDTPQSSIIKVLLGEELSTGVVLTELTSDSIKLQGKDEIYEFKLFERATNETK